MNFVEFQDLLALPFVVSKKGSMFQRPSGPAPRGYPRREIIFCSSGYHHFSFLICFVFHNELKHLHVMHVENVLWCFCGRLTLSLLPGLANLVT